MEAGRMAVISVIEDEQVIEKILRTPIQPNTTYVVISFSLTHKDNFSIVLPWKSNVLSHTSGPDNVLDIHILTRALLYSVWELYGPELPLTRRWV